MTKEFSQLELKNESSENAERMLVLGIEQELHKQLYAACSGRKGSDIPMTF